MPQKFCLDQNRTIVLFTEKFLLYKLKLNLNYNKLGETFPLNIM